VRRDSEKTRALLLLGPTGSGKTPLGDFLEKRPLWGKSCSHFDFGRELRRVVAGENASVKLSREEVAFLEEVLRTGALLEDEHFYIAEKLLRAFIAGRRMGRDDLLVLNGLPRHVGQAEAVDAIVDVRAVINLSCPARVVMERIRTNRGGDRVGRTDDDVEAVRAKLRLFARRIAPVVDHYRKRGARIETVEVDEGTRPEDVWKALAERLARPSAKDW